MKCSAHPDVETNLACSKCGKPICPKCLVQTPVGARCQDCASLSKLPTYCVSASCYLKAIGTALGMAIACGVIWGLIGWLIYQVIQLFSFNLILAPAAGYAIGEMISRATNRKRGTGLAVIAGIAVVLSYAITVIFFRGLPLGLFNILYHLLALGLGTFVAVNRMR